MFGREKEGFGREYEAFGHHFGGFGSKWEEVGRKSLAQGDNVPRWQREKCHLG